MMLKQKAASILELAAKYSWTKLASARDSANEAVYWLDHNACKFDIGTAMLRATREMSLPLFDKGLVLAFDMLRDHINGYRKDFKPEDRITVCQWNDTIADESIVKGTLLHLADSLR